MSSAVRLMGKFAKPGKIEQRYSRIGILRRRHVSTTETNRRDAWSCLLAADMVSNCSFYGNLSIKTPANGNVMFRTKPRAAGGIVADAPFLSRGVTRVQILNRI